MNDLIKKLRTIPMYEWPSEENGKIINQGMDSDETVDESLRVFTGLMFNNIFEPKHLVRCAIKRLGKIKEKLSEKKYQDTEDYLYLLLKLSDTWTNNYEAIAYEEYYAGTNPDRFIKVTMKEDCEKDPDMPF